MKPVSKESINLLKQSGVDKVVIISRFPIDRYNCICQSQVRKELKEFSKLNDENKQKWIDEKSPIQCPLSKNKKLYILICQNCGEVVAQVNADNESLNNWCNLHYVSWYNEEGWRGAFGVKICSDKEDIRIECCCGETKSFKSYIIKLIK